MTSSVLDPAGPVGAAEKLILLDALVIMLAIVVPTILCILAFAWWYRATNTRAAYTPRWEYSVLIVGFVIIGSLWIMTHLNHMSVPMDGLMRMQR